MVNIWQGKFPFFAYLPTFEWTKLFIERAALYEPLSTIYLLSEIRMQLHTKSKEKAG